MRRHFTATGFVVREDRTVLHWHKRLQQWMPPGGHSEPDEDPVTTVLREIREEAGLEAEVIPLAPTMPFDYPGQLPAPYTILVENSPELGQPHQHIDFIYFCRPLDGPAEPPPDPTMRWVDEGTLRANRPLNVAGRSLSAPVATDVRLLALLAIDTARRATASR